MASPALVAGSSQTILDWPIFVRKLVITTGATAGNVAHGCPATPFIAVPVSIGAIDNSNEVTIVSKDATNLNIDCEDDGNNSVEILVMCVPKGPSAAGSPPAADVAGGFGVAG